MIYTDVMIDLETLGTQPNAAITQIGACAFSFNSDNADAYVSFNQRVNAQTCIDLGMSVDWKTIQWWLTQSEQARNVMASSGGREPLIEALDYFTAWAKSWCVDGIKRVWGHGPTFDITIIEHAYRRCEKSVPWTYRAPRDTRTYIDLIETLGLNVNLEQPACKHDAESDAIAQAQWVMAIHRALPKLEKITDVAAPAQA